VDLHCILSGYTFAKNARKEELQTRILELLKAKQITEVEKKELQKSIERCFSKM
jgi:hypothetical protein